MCQLKQEGGYCKAINESAEAHKTGLTTASKTHCICQHVPSGEFNNFTTTLHNWLDITSNTLYCCLSLAPPVTSGPASAEAEIV